MEKQLISINEASEKYGLPRSWLRKQVKSGDILAHKSGWKYLIPVLRLEAFLGGNSDGSERND